MDVEALKSELTYKAVRSSGSGGQNVNKVASKVVLYFNLEASDQFTDEEKTRLTEYLQNRLNKLGVLILDSSESRSQFRNKALVTQKFLDLIIGRIIMDDQSRVYHEIYYLRLLNIRPREDLRRTLIQEYEMLLSSSDV